MSDSKLEKIYQRLGHLENNMIEFQKSITAIPALSPKNGGSGELEKVLFIKRFLEENGVSDITRLDAPDPDAQDGVRPSLIARINGRSSEKTIWLMAHSDVVPEGDLKRWHSNPWECVVADGKIYGRGTEDNQQGLTSSIFTLLAFLQEGVQPVYDLCVIVAADEETGSELGLDYILENHGEFFRPDDLIIVPDAGLPDSTMIEIAEKSILWLRFTTHGKQCHGSEPEKGINAFKAASHLVTRLEKLYEQFDDRDELFAPPISTFEPTQKEANVPNVNTIPGEDVFYLDCRILPQYPVEAVMTAVKNICAGVEKDFAVKIDIATTQVAEAAPPTPADAEIVTLLKNGIKSVYGVEAKAMGIGGGTVAAFFRRKGLNAVVWSTLDETCHQPNEYCIIENMVNDARVFANVCLKA